MLTRGKLLLVKYRVEHEKWDRRFGFVHGGKLFAPSIWCETNMTVQGSKHPNSNLKLLRSLIKSPPTFNTN